jgi:hypothetical protein
MPDLAFFFKAFTLSLHDDLAKNSQGSLVQVYHNIKTSIAGICDFNAQLKTTKL